MILPELVVFLGNPGAQYRRTRHNAAWLFAQKLALPAVWQQRFKGRYAPLSLRSAPTGDSAVPSGSTAFSGAARTCHLLMPETFMNKSGEAAQAAASFFKIEPQAVLVVHDDLELKLGEVGLKQGGGLGGHNGLRSLAVCLGTPDFWRFRLGIGRPGGIKEKGQDILSWVLGAFLPDEEAAFAAVLDAAAPAFMRLLEEGPQALLPAWKKTRLCEEARP